MGLPLNPRLKAALEAVHDACMVTRHLQQDSIQHITKADRSPVTVADLAAQAVVARRLRQRLGEVDIAGEESSALLRGDDQAEMRAAVLQAVRRVWPEADGGAMLDAIDHGTHDASARAYWTLDPIDGTKGYLRGQQYAVSLAYIEDGQVLEGVLGCPNLSPDLHRPFDQPDPKGLIYFAAHGGGSWVRPADERDAPPLRVETSRPEPGARIRVCESVERGHSRQDQTARIVELLGGAGIPARLDSQCKYAVVARGQADAYLRLPTRADYVENVWDHAAGMLVAVEAGAMVTDVDGRPLDFSCGTGLARNRGVVCATPHWHGRIIEAIAQLAAP